MRNAPRPHGATLLCSRCVHSSRCSTVGSAPPKITTMAMLFYILSSKVDISRSAVLCSVQYARIAIYTVRRCLVERIPRAFVTIAGAKEHKRWRIVTSVSMEETRTKRGTHLRCQWTPNTRLFGSRYCRSQSHICEPSTSAGSASSHRLFPRLHRQR